MNTKKNKPISNKPSFPAKTAGERINPLIEIFPREIKILKVKDIKRGMSRLISDFCKGKVLSEDAKTLSYLFSTYIQIINQAEQEQRIEEIEKRLRIK